jgi:hypothetical protein
MKCRSSAIALAPSAVALVVSLMASPRPDPLPELCTETAEADLRRFEEAMHIPPALAASDLATRKQIKESLITSCSSGESPKAPGGSNDALVERAPSKTRSPSMNR